MQTEADIVALAEAYGAAAGVPLSTVSARVFNDGKRIAQIRDGRGITLSRFNGALVWFSTHWPDGAVWPQGIARPAPLVERPLKEVSQ